LAKQSRQQRGTPAPAASPDTPAQQQAARAMLWLLALIGVAIVAGGLYLLAGAPKAGKLQPIPFGLGVVLAAIGAACCWAGMYAARHSTLRQGRLKFDAAAHALISSPGFVRTLKWAGHAVGITVLATSWLSFYYPEGIPYQ
jgi:hypothetical protein